MGLLKNIVLVAGGVAAGYLASRVNTATVSGTDVELKQPAPLQKVFSEGGSMAQFFDSKYGAPFKHTALKALSFAATVKAGMDEKEAELKNRFERQSQDPRPGSLDSWQGNREGQGAQELIESEVLPNHEQARRIRRDAALGEDFFGSKN